MGQVTAVPIGAFFVLSAAAAIQAHVKHEEAFVSCQGWKWSLAQIVSNPAFSARGASSRKTFG
jgi:hypothetical protein